MIHKTWLQNHSMGNDGTSALKDMVNERGETCVSIIVPTHRLGQEWKNDRTEILRGVLAADASLGKKSADLSPDIDSLFQQIDFNKKKEGVGIFVSPHVKRLVTFPFPVTRKIVVNKSFHLQDLIYIENYAVTYFLLDLSKKEIHLFKGTLDCLEEIRDDDFPKHIKDNYEYNKPSQSNSASGYAHVKEVEKDKSILNQQRLKKMFRVTDKLLSKYITRKDIPLLLCGPTKDLSIYKSATKHPDNIIATMSDNYKSTSVHDLGVLAWLQIKSFIDDQKLKLVNDFKEKTGEGLGVCGIEEIWEPTREGRGLVLLVEKDYEKIASVTKNQNLVSQLPNDTTARECNVVDEIINTVLEKNGSVVVVEKGILEDYGRIGLIMRY